jgi:hypothetical protein
MDCNHKGPPKKAPIKPPKEHCKDHGNNKCKDHCQGHCQDCCKDQHSECVEDCLCKLLREFVGKTFEFQTKSGNFITGKIECITKDCCVAIIEPEVLTPHIPERVTIIRCKDIESFSKELVT